MPSPKIKEILEKFQKEFDPRDSHSPVVFQFFLEKSLTEIEEATRMAIIGEIVKMPGWSDDYEKIIKKIQSQLDK